MTRAFANAISVADKGLKAPCPQRDSSSDEAPVPVGLPQAELLEIVDWGLLPYREAHQRQLEAVSARLEGRIPDTVFLVEHPHVYTYGRGTKHDPGTLPPLADGIECVAVERGGDITYHGPGQLVAYPVVDVKALTGDLHRFLYGLEEVIIRTIAAWGIKGEHHPKFTGVWVGERKIASIGVAVRKWVSYHGIALNVSTDLRYFNTIRPCGLAAQVMTSMDQRLRFPVNFREVKMILAQSLAAEYVGKVISIHHR